MIVGEDNLSKNKKGEAEEGKDRQDSGLKKGGRKK